MRTHHAVRQQVQLEVDLRHALRGGVFLDEHGDQRALAGGQALGQFGLGVVTGVAQGACQGGAVFRQEAGGGGASRCVQCLASGVSNGSGRLEQRGRIVDFQPVAGGVLGADSEGKAQHRVNLRGVQWCKG